MRFLIAVCLAASAMGQRPAPDILSRVAQEAEKFSQRMPSSISQEKLEQRTLATPGLHVATAQSSAPAEPRLTRTVISEYTVAPLNGVEDKELVEFRQVLSVDGRTLQSEESARRALSLGILSAGEGARKRMLEDFAKHGLVDVASDYALILMAFTTAGRASLKIVPSGQDRVGPDDALLYAWTQAGEGSGELSFHGKQSSRLPLAGKLWARKSDGVPLRVWVWAVRNENKHSARDEATIDYVRSAQGFLAPVSVLHRHLVDGQFRTENLYHYEPFQPFAANAELQPSRNGTPPRQ